MLTLDQIRRVHVELSTRCNSRCPMCPRNYRGLDYNSGYPICDMSLEDFQHIITPILHQLKLNKSYGVNFNGNLGDFALARDGSEIVNWLADNQVRISINTNGSLRSPAWWASLARTGTKIGFALDGLADTHALYRQDTDWNRVIENAKAFIAAGGHAIWRFVPFDHNRAQEAACRKLAIDLGFAGFENIYDGRDAGPVYTRDGKFSHWLGPASDAPPIDALLESHKTWFNHKTIRIEKDTTDLNLRCQHLVNQEIYIAADGSVYPCCYLGFYPGKMQHPGNEQLVDMVQENNALEYDLAHCMNWFAQVEQSWQQDSIANGRLYACVNSCNQV